MNNYYYGTGRVRSLEARMLAPDQVERMAAAADFESAFGVLPETSYADHLPKLKHAFDFEELLELEEKSLKDLIKKLAPEDEIIAALLKKHDYLNWKILLRSSLSENKEIEDFPDKDLFAVVTKAYEEEKDPQVIDFILDKHYFAYLKKVCQASPSLLIKNMVNYQIDLINIKTLVRAQRLKKDKKFLAKALLEPGLIGKDTLLNLLDSSFQDISLRLNYTEYFPKIAGGFAKLAESGSAFLLEKQMDDFIIGQFRKAKYLSSGVEPIVGFYLAKEAEMKTIRFILISQSNYIGSEQIKERLRISYV
ncbi:MAG: V-type ATPase subunit [Candidatus Margulisiibacteriota bacterium]